METRAHLLDCALHLFADHGYDAVGVQAIVEAAGVTKPTLYHYFGSKRGLFEALVREKSEPLTAALTEAAHNQHDVTRSITLIVRAYFEFAAWQPTFYRMMLSLWFAPPSTEYSGVVRDVLEQQTHLIERMFAQAEADHGNMRGRNQQYAVSLRGLIDSYIGLSLHGYIDLKQDDFQYRIIHQFMHGIFS